MPQKVHDPGKMEEETEKNQTKSVNIGLTGQDTSWCTLEQPKPYYACRKLEEWMLTLCEIEPNEDEVFRHHRVLPYTINNVSRRRSVTVHSRTQFQGEHRPWFTLSINRSDSEDQAKVTYDASKPTEELIKIIRIVRQRVISLPVVTKYKTRVLNSVSVLG